MLARLAYQDVFWATKGHAVAFFKAEDATPFPALHVQLWSLQIGTVGSAWSLGGKLFHEVTEVKILEEGSIVLLVPHELLDVC